VKDVNSSESRWVVAHCGSRDDYQLPIALHESGQLHRFVTDWYSPLDSRIIDVVLKCLPERLRLELARRYRKELPSRLVKDVKLSGLLKSVFGTDALDTGLNRLVGERAASVANASGSSLLITSYYGWAAFPRVAKSTKKVLFQIHPHPWFLRKLYKTYQSELDADAGFRDEAEMKASEEFLRCWGQESVDADVVIAASSFTRQSLVNAGVRGEKIHVVPYGVDGDIFRNDVGTPSGIPKVLFVGQTTVRKGFQNLLETWKRIGNRGAELHIVSGATAVMAGVNSSGTVVWHGRLALADLVELMNRVDLLVLPSIAEGFGHVLLQSLSCGTPILCSDATAGPDLLSGWEDGFIFPSRDWDELASRLDYWLSNVERLRRLRGAARDRAEGLPWHKFRREIRNACSAAPAL
jgi:glycosyltransferase involved in cell wall biosynthesis